MTLGAALPSVLPSVPDRFTERFWYLLAMYMLGCWANRDPTLWQRLRESRATLVCSAAATLAGALAATRGLRVSYRWQWAWSPALALVALARAAEAIEDAAASRPLRFVGRNSIVYYTAHFPVAYAAIRLVERQGVRDGARALAAALAASLATPTALVLARRRSAAVRRLFAL
jgi:peptidoglycan/LPS O-acetylase OafA/YrhL